MKFPLIFSPRIRADGFFSLLIVFFFSFYVLSMPRLFIAISLPDSVRRSLAYLGADRVEGLRPVAPERMHLTLRFLGNEEIDPVIEALGSLSPPNSFSLSLSGTGVFGSRRRPTVLWAGVEACSALLDLQESVEQALHGHGFPRETRPYFPHITLGRFRREPAPSDASVAEFLKQHESLRLPPFPVNSFELFASESDQDGVRHRVIQRFPLRM